MGGLMSRNKGQRGEREVIALLQPTVDRLYVQAGYPTPILARNLSQSREGGFDIAGLEWLAIEVKYQENENVKGWWEQACRQAGVDHLGMPLQENGMEVPVIGGVRVLPRGELDGRKSPGVGRIMTRTPILFYRSNRNQWKVQLIGRLFGEKSQFRTPVRVDIRQFMAWFELRLKEELEKIRAAGVEQNWK